MVKKYLVATVHVLVEFEEEVDATASTLDGMACDGFSDSMRVLYPFVKDWSYDLNISNAVGHHWLELPLVEGKFEEGDFIEVMNNERKDH